MNIKTLQYRLNHLKGVAFNLIHMSFRDNILKQGITEPDFLEFTIVDKIKEEIESELIAFILKNEVDENLETHKFNFFICMSPIVKKYAFLAEPETQFFHRKCSATGEVFSEGFVTNTDKYYKYSKDLVNHLRNLQTEEESKLSDLELMEKAYNEDYCYHTTWEDASDLCYAVDSEGTIHTIND